MSDKEISIKTALDTIQVPAEKLDGIIDEVLYERPVKKTFLKKWLYPVAAAAILVVAMATTTMVASPTVASFVVQIPIIGNVFNFLGIDENSFENYEEFSESVGLSESSNGINMIIDQAIYDGTNVTLSFLIESDKLSGKGFMFENLPAANGSMVNGGFQMEYVEDVGYVGIFRLTPDFTDGKSKVEISWKPEAIMTEDGEIKGDWEFNFAVPKISSESIVLDEKVKTEGVTVHIKEAAVTDVSVNIYYQQLVDPAYLTKWQYVEAELIARDNLGKVYKVPYNGGSTDSSAKTAEDLNWSATLSGLDPQASSLTFYPIAAVSRVDSETGDIDSKRITFDALEIDLNDHSHKVIENPEVPELPEARE